MPVTIFNMIRKDSTIKLNIDALTSEGNGVGRHEGMAIFVPETAVGDVVLCKVVAPRKTYAYGEVVKVLDPSEDRCDPECSVYHQCGGCSYRHINYEAELRAKEEVVRSAVQRIGKLDCPVLPILHTSETKRYRNKAQYPVRESDGKLSAGFFAKRTHQVIDCKDCLLEPEAFSKVVEVVKYFLSVNKISAYNEKEHSGVVRHIYLRQSATTGEVHLCVVINAKGLPKQREFVAFINANCPEVSGISLNINTKRTNVVLGDTTRTIWGKGYITDTLLGKEFHISVGSFYQVNHDGTEVLYSEVKRLLDLKPQETLVDLYCGIGTIGLCVAEDSNNLVGVEVVPQAVENARENAKLNGITNAEFYCSTAKDASTLLKQQGKQADAVIVDPPRKGIDEVTAENIVSFNPKRIVYVSCNPATLARDLAVLEKLGYKTESVTPVDMFPRTTHVETVVLLSRK